MKLRVVGSGRPRPVLTRERSVSATVLLACILLLGAHDRQLVAEDLSTDYVERYFETFPTRATAAGRHDRDSELEDLGAERRAEWIAFQEETAFRIRKALAAPSTEDDRLDLELLLRQTELEHLRWAVLRSPERNPLFWTEIASQATVFLLVREDRPAEARLASAAARAEQLPRLLGQAQAALDLCPNEDLAPDLVRLAVSQLRSLAAFYGAGFAKVAETRAPGLTPRLSAAGARASESLSSFADHLDERSTLANGSPRTGKAYSELFRIYTGGQLSPAEVEKQALEDLADKRREAAAFGDEVWQELMGEEKRPARDEELLRGLFRHVEGDRASSVEAFVSDYRTLSESSIRFVRERDLLTLPQPLPIEIGTSPDYFMGQGVGGVYPPGPYAPGSPTLLFLPTPSSDASDEQKSRLFSAFNHAFNTMITPHELVPGHTFQLASAALHERKVRALFPDDVYVEGWGTFAERLMLDLGWGDSAARVAHLKKQLENIARLIVDIRVHSGDISEEQVLAFVRDEALQDEQFARNMWLRAITSSPQLTTYHLGYRQVMGLYEDVRRARGEDFDLKAFLDGMMELGPVPVAVYRERMLGAETTP